MPNLADPIRCEAGSCCIAAAAPRDTQRIGVYHPDSPLPTPAFSRRRNNSIYWSQDRLSPSSNPQTRIASPHILSSIFFELFVPQYRAPNVTWRNRLALQLTFITPRMLASHTSVANSPLSNMAQSSIRRTWHVWERTKSSRFGPVC